MTSDWFSSIKDKGKHSFLVFDIVDFYPSISEALLKSSLEYAKQHTTISDEDVEIIMHSRKTLLSNGNEPWVKKGDSKCLPLSFMLENHVGSTPVGRTSYWYLFFWVWLCHRNLTLLTSGVE